MLKAAFSNPNPIGPEELRFIDTGRRKLIPIVIHTSLLSMYVDALCILYTYGLDSMYLLINMHADIQLRTYLS